MLFIVLALPLATANLSFDGVIDIAAGDRRVAAAQQAVLAAEGRAGATRAWLAPTVKSELRLGEDASPILGAGYTFTLPQDVTRRRALGSTTELAWQSPVGTDVTLRLGLQVADTDDTFATLKTTYAPSAGVTMRQHLLRGAGLDARLASYTAAVAAVTGAEATRAGTQRDIVRAAALAYVGLMRAEQSLELGRRYVEQGQEFTRLSEELVKGGLQSAIDLSVAEQSVATRELELARNEAATVIARRALSQSLRGAPQADAFLDATAEPLSAVLSWCTDDFQRLGDLQAAAVAADPRLAELEAQHRGLLASLAATTNAALPDVQVGIDAQSAGLAGTSNCSNGYALDGLTPCAPKAAFVGGPIEAFRGAGSGQLYGVAAVASVALPLWSEPNNAAISAARAELAAIDAERETGLTSVQIEIRAQVMQLDQARRILARADAAESAAKRAADAEVTKLKVGRSTALDVLRVQDAVLAAALERTEALAALATAIIEVRARTMQLSGRAGERLACLPPTRAR